jgi:hypothetical protein
VTRVASYMCCPQATLTGRLGLMRRCLQRHPSLSHLALPRRLLLLLLRSLMMRTMGCRVQLMMCPHRCRAQTQKTLRSW